MKSTIFKILVSVISIVAVGMLFFFGERIFPEDVLNNDTEQESDAYIDAFQFEPEELSYDGTGDIDLLEGVSLEGYTTQELKTKVFTHIYAGDTLSEKKIQYTAETEEGKVRSTRSLKLHNYSGPKIIIPNNLPEVTRQSAENFASLLATKSGYAVDDGFGNDVKEHAEISYEKDNKESALLHYKIVFDNMFGDEDVKKVDVLLSGVPAYLALADSEITLGVGEAFDPMSYVTKAELTDGTKVFDAVLSNGVVDTSKEGTYEVKYDLLGEELTLLVNVG